MWLIISIVLTIYLDLDKYAPSLCSFRQFYYEPSLYFLGLGRRFSYRGMNRVFINSTEIIRYGLGQYFLDLDSYV